jgi:arylsulfatase A-like enzyme
MALMKASAPAEGADADLGIVKYGQFPPLGLIGAQRDGADDNFSYKSALYAPPPTDLSFPLSLEADVSLSFSVCLAKQTPAGDSATFEVWVRSDGEKQRVWTHSASAIPSDWVWRAGSVDLSDYTGRSVDLVLRTRSEGGHPHPMWGNPVVDALAPQSEPLNVILIAVDTLRADRLSSYGYDKPTTPNIDALAGDGVRFEHVVSNANWTCPSFASIFTGLVPARHGVVSLGLATPLSASFETLAERFQARGWGTRAIAYKVPLYDGGFEQGFDVSFNVPRYFARAGDNLEEALNWLESRARRRNFLFLHFNDPHQPFTQPPAFESAFGPPPSRQGLSLPFNLADHEANLDRQSTASNKQELRELMRGLYDGEVAYVDDRIGVFLSALKRRGLYDDAVIAFVSDHGEQQWERGEYGHRGEMLNDEVVRVPLIVKDRGEGRARGKVVKTQVRAFDVMPTLLELAGIPPEGELQAESLAALLAPDAPDAPDRIAVTESSRGSLALRNRNWKYIISTQPGETQSSEALFDLRGDAGEEHDLARSRPEVCARMRVQAMDYVLRNRSGHYLVAIAEAASSYDHAVDGVKAASSLFGRAPERDGPDRVVFKGDSAGPLLLVAELAPDGPVGVRDTQIEPNEFPRYHAGDLERLLSQPRAGLHFFAGPPPPLAADVGRRSVDHGQLEALEALGYVGGDS